MKTPNRETIARKEIGKTHISRRTALFLCISFLLMLTVVAGADLYLRVIKGDAPVFSSPQAPQKAAGWFLWIRRHNTALLEQINAYENHLNQHSPLTQLFVPPIQQGLTQFLHTGNEKVYVGKNLWLFYRPGMDYLMGPNFMAPQILQRRRRSTAEWQKSMEPNPVAAIVEFHRQLKQQGIALLVVPTPTKAMLYGNQFMSLRSSDEAVLNNPGYDHFVRQLHAENIEVLHLHDILAAQKQTSLYLQTDSHWTPHGVSVAAEAIAKRIASMVPNTKSTSALYQMAPTQIENQGDLAAMLRISNPSAPINKERVTIHRVVTKNHQNWRPDKTAPVLLLGDSFSNIYSLDGMNWGVSSGLAEHISYHLNTPIDAIRINDNGSYATRQYLSRSQQQGKNRLAGKKVVVYQFAIRELSAGNWKTGLSMSSSSSTAHSTTPLLSKTQAISGRVKKIKPISNPQNSTYQDCLIPLLLSNVKTANGATLKEDIIVYLWGMLGGEMTAHNHIPVGKTIAVEATPFEQVEDQIGSYRRLDFSDKTSMALNAYVGDSRVPGKNTGAPTPPPPRAQEAPPQTAKGAPVTIATNRGPEPSPASEFLNTVTSIVKRTPAPVYVSQSGWMFLSQELSHLTKGAFWGDRAANVSIGESPDVADPLPAILDFHRQLKKRGIELVLVPVPPKAVVYANELTDGKNASTGRTDFYHQQFYSILAKRGIAVVDLTSPFIAAKEHTNKEVYCRQDSHWSGYGCQIAANKIYARIATQIGDITVEKTRYYSKERTVQIDGDLWRKLADNSIPKETVSLTGISTQQDSLIPVEPWKQSPVLLLGDSHTLVFSAGGDMHAKGSGLPDHLAATLGFPVDVMGIRGSGATMARVSLLRREDSLAGKKIVIWCFTARDFTESAGGWAIVPVER